MDILANTSSAVFDRMTIFGCSLKKMVTGTMLV